MPFIGFFLNNRIGQFIGIAILLSSAFFGWLAVHDHNLWNEATEKFNTMQQQLLDQKKEEFKQKTEEIDQNASKLQEEIKRREEEAKKQLEEIEKKAAEETKTEKPVTDDAAPYLKSIVKQLDLTYGEKKK
jgi:septal ring factor EnvC (AmiA/AmiB activator)